MFLLQITHQPNIRNMTFLPNCDSLCFINRVTTGMPEKNTWPVSSWTMHLASKSMVRSPARCWSHDTSTTGRVALLIYCFPDLWSRCCCPAGFLDPLEPCQFSSGSMEDPCLLILSGGLARLSQRGLVSHFHKWCRTFHSSHASVLFLTSASFTVYMIVIAKCRACQSEQF